MNKKIYIAGPEVFYPNACEILQYKNELCSKYGYIGYSPFDNEIKTKDKKEQRNIIKHKNEELIRKCDIVIANLNSFRGFEPDSGTCFEVGFATALGKKIYVYLYDHNKELKERYAKYNNLKSISVYNLEGNDIEDFNIPINIMFSNATIKGTFEECLIDLANKIS